MAQDGSWPSIAEHGLLSTSALLDLYRVTGERREALERRHRPQSVAIARSGLPGAVVRDQKPMREGSLRECLDDGLTPADWYLTLNQRVFFWPSRKRLRGLLNARAYRKDVQTVLTLDTRSIVDAYADVIQLSPINSGATIMSVARRGRQTFAPILEFPLEPYRRRRGHRQIIAEVVIPDRVVSIKDHVLAVHRVRASEVLEELWRSPRALQDDGP
ncbi:DUF7002 family protein [Methylobacterium gregans]